MKPMLVVNWYGHGQEFIPWPEADDYWRLVPVVGEVILLDITSHDIFNDLEKSLAGVGLGEDRDRSPSELGLKPAGWARGGHEHEAGREVRPAMFDSSIQVFATHPGHVLVTQDHIVAASGEQFERFTPADRDVNIVPGPPQREVKQLARIRFILDDQDAIGHLVGSTGSRAPTLVRGDAGMRPRGCAIHRRRYQ
jgi:hypothetical protein